MSLMSIMPEELKSLLLATAKRRTHLASASSTIPYLRTGYHQQQGCSSKIKSLTQLSYPTRKTPAEQEDAMLVATVGGRQDIPSLQELGVDDSIETINLESGYTKIMSSDCCGSRCRQNADADRTQMEMEVSRAVTASMDSAFPNHPPSKLSHTIYLLHLKKIVERILLSISNTLYLERTWV
ncbi:hypothetical protein ASPTUDRAFT_35296 [Aspergillus tubingensis CBS 134.48]|uniref:Uncharacterized protein n=1 Tax=Aspergillus tubingensis (strain CBS 134.48) TaxID=767770 RepID=A0A1L9NIW5_ASPTC|nr:hypothetical protein ASPTUDRAFT_35296 [Aspergillus tubingensis CBS 134.48]